MYSPNPWHRLCQFMRAIRTVLYVLFIAFILAVACSGCTPSVQTATKPAQPSSVQPPSVTDSAESYEHPPVPPEGVDTAPQKVTTYDDQMEGGILLTKRVSVVRTPDIECASGIAVTVLYLIADGTRLEEVCGPAFGESLHLTPEEKAPRVATLGHLRSTAPDTVEVPGDTAHVPVLNVPGFFAGGLDKDVTGGPKPEEVPIKTSSTADEQSWGIADVPQLLGWGVIVLVVIGGGILLVRLGLPI